MTIPTFSGVEGNGGFAAVPLHLKINFSVTPTKEGSQSPFNQRLKVVLVISPAGKALLNIANWNSQHPVIKPQGEILMLPIFLRAYDKS